jgi:hypothetical protein
MPAGSSGPVNSIGDFNLTSWLSFVKFVTSFHSFKRKVSETGLRLVLFKDVQIILQLFFDLKFFRFL